MNPESSAQLAYPTNPVMPNNGMTPKTSKLAITSFVLGLSTLIFLFFTGIPALICGHLSLGKIKRSNGALGGKGFAITGLVLGYVSFLLTVVIASLAALATPVIMKQKKKADLAQLSNNAKQLAMPIFQYTENLGAYPEELESLVEEGFMSQRTLDDLQPKKGGSWKYFQVQPGNYNDDTIIMASPVEIDSERVILYLNGSVRQLNDADYEAAIRAQQQP